MPAAKERTTTTSNITITVREVDFVTRFARNWDHLREIMSIMRPVPKSPGTKLTTKKARVTLQSGSVDEGAEIPYSQAEVYEEEYGDVTIEKYSKAVSIESINKYGYENAVQRTDDEFLVQLQNVVTGKFYTFLKGGLLTSGKTTFQAALAEAQGRVRNKWQGMHKSTTSIVGFCNILDLYDYLGGAQITVQTAFGLNYIRDFMGYSTLFLMSDNEIPSGTVIATPSENIVNYYVNPDDSDFAKAGLSYRTDGETNLIGFHVDGNYKTAVSESFAIMGMFLLAEYKDGIAVVTFKGSMGTVAATSAAGTTSGTKLTITTPSTIPEDWTFYFKSQATNPPSAPDYLAAPTGYTKLTVVNGVADNVTATNAHKGILLAVNAAGQVVAKSDTITVTA